MAASVSDVQRLASALLLKVRDSGGKPLSDTRACQVSPRCRIEAIASPWKRALVQTCSMSAALGWTAVGLAALVVRGTPKLVSDHYSATKLPLLPPCFSNSLTPPIVIPLSTALHMS